MTGRRVSLIWLMTVVIGVATISAMWLIPYYQYVRQQREAVSRLENEREGLARRVEQLTQELAGLRTAEPSEAGGGDAGRAAAMAALSAEEKAKRLEQLRLLASTQEQLAKSTAAAADLENRIQELEQAVAKAVEESKQLAASEGDLRERLASSNRVIEAQQEELKAGAARLARMETQSRTLNEQTREAERKLARSTKLVQELDNITRRQESLLTSIFQRYRDVNDQYRSAAMQFRNLERDSGPSSVDLSRIESLVSLAEEDLRQLRELNARAAKVRQELGR